MDPAYGDCGVSTIYILDGYDTGIAQVNEGVGSTQGAIVAVSYGVNWYNYTTHNGAGFTGWSSNFSTTWSHTDYINSGSGYVSAQLFGVVTLYWGGHCTINYPYDENTIS